MSRLTIHTFFRMSKCRQNLILSILVALLIVYLIVMWSDNISLQSSILKNKVYYLHVVSEFDIKQEWFAKPENYCDGNFQGFSHDWAMLKDVTFVPGKTFKFQLMCKGNSIPYRYSFKHLFHDYSHLNDWLSRLDLTVIKPPIEYEEEKVTLAVRRYEYANMYHQITDYYNAFVLMNYLKVKPDNFNIFLIDIHADSALDQTWDVLFGDVLLLKNVSKSITFTTLVWSVLGYNSPLNFHSLHSLPYVKEFSRFFKSRYGYQQEKKLDCSLISILFIWRRDYYAHPGNPSGQISRKISNENELIQEIKSKFPGHKVVGTQLDKYEMKYQIKWISQTDILIGMHGAGMSHILQLPSHAGVLELFPTYWGKSTQHFKAMAKWRKLHYLNWQNINPNNEKEGFYTHIPPTVISQRVKTLYQKMCS